MISVYVREINQEEGNELGEFKPGELKSLVNLFQSYSTFAITIDGRAKFAIECKFSSARFVSGPDSDGAYFEIIVAAPES